MSVHGRPIRVLRVIARLNVGGPSLHVTYLARGLAERGYETTLVAGDVGRGEESMAFVAESEGVDVVRLPGLSRALSPVRDVAAAWRLARIIRRVRPDVVHTHTAKAGAVGRFGALLSGTRPVIVHTFHGHVLRGYFGAGGTLIFRAIETTLARLSDRLIAVSPEVRDELVRLRVAPERKFSVIRLGIELEQRVRFEGDTAEVRRRHGIPAEKFVVGWFGRMTAVKRTDDLLTMLTGTRERGIDAMLHPRRRRRRPPAARAARPRPGPRTVLSLPRLPGEASPVVRDLRRRHPDLRERGNPGHDHRGAGGRTARWSRPASAACPDVVDDGETGFLVRPQTRTRSPNGSRSSPATRSDAPRMGRLGRERVLAATPSTGSWTTSTRSTASCSARRAPRRAVGSDRTR